MPVEPVAEWAGTEITCGAGCFSWAADFSNTSDRFFSERIKKQGCCVLVKIATALSIHVAIKQALRFQHKVLLDHFLRCKKLVGLLAVGRS